MRTLPEVVLVERAAWTSERNHVRERFEVYGGDITEEWARGLRPPRVPWCSVTIWDEGVDVVVYGGEVWPSAWPALFSVTGPAGRQRTSLTELGVKMFDQARVIMSPNIRAHGA